MRGWRAPAKDLQEGEIATQQAVSTVDSWRLAEAQAGSRALDVLLWWLGGAAPGRAPSGMGAVIFFRESSAGLDAAARASLRDRLTILEARPGVRVVIGGVASSRGDAAYRLRLTLRRVAAIRRFLLSHDLHPDRIEVAVRGSDWSLRERPRGRVGEAPPQACRLQITDPGWELSRN